MSTQKNEVEGSKSGEKDQNQSALWLRQLLVRGAMLAAVWTFANHVLFSGQKGYFWYHTVLTFVIAFVTWSAMSYLFYLLMRWRMNKK